jgi:branched-chain amino acid transport system permease protein
MLDRLTISIRASHLIALTFFAISLGFALVATLLGDTFYMRLASEALIFGGLALSVDFLLGFVGQLSLGQALYFGIGAYASALVLMQVPSFWLAMGGAILAVLISSLIGGLIVNRVRGIYFALITFGLAQVAAKVVYNTRELGASDGIIGIPVININLLFFSFSAANPLAFFLFVLAIVMGFYLLAAWLLETPAGRAMIAIRANEQRVAFLGYSVRNIRLGAYVFAAMIAGVSGALYPVLRGFVSPELMYFATSGNAVIAAIVGGVGTLIGAIIGSVLIVGAKSVVGSWTEHHVIFIGILFMAVVLFMPKGIFGFVRERIEARMIGKATRAEGQTSGAHGATRERA